MNSRLAPLCLMAACAKPADVVSAPQTAPSEVQASDAPAWDGPPPLYEDMRGHYDVMMAARDALIDGQFDAARSGLLSMAERRVHPSIPDDLKMYAFGMKASAYDANYAETTQQLASSLGHTINWCGKCHEAAEVTFDLTPEPAPPSVGVHAHNARHVWVANRFWDALIAPSDEAWSQGTRALQEDAFMPEVAEPTAGQDPAIAAIGQLVHTLGLDADDADAQLDRADVIGAVLAACTDCHASHRTSPVGPSTP